MRFIDKTILASDITPKAVFENRRNIIKTAAAGGFGMALAPWFSREALASTPEKLAAILNPAFADKDDALHMNHALRAVLLLHKESCENQGRHHHDEQVTRRGPIPVQGWPHPEDWPVRIC